MQKIGILTFQNTINYGAMLQALALSMKLKEMNVDCEIINYHCKNVEYREKYIFPKFSFNIIKYMKDVKYYFTISKKRKYINEFKKKNMMISKKNYYRKNICEANSEYDKFIVGSDMVFNLNITGGDKTYYLDFAETSKRNSYAASLGEVEINEDHLNECITELNKFKYLSVREEETKKYFDSILSIQSNFNCDPTLLYDGSFWQKYEQSPKFELNKKYILLYFLDKEGVILETATKIAKENNYEIISLNLIKEHIDNLRCIVDVAVGEFLYLIHHAVLVITGSYHGMIFSMNYNTNFMYYNRANSSRMESIAKITNSLDRRLTKNHMPGLRCDFKNINNSIRKVREESTEYLNKIIKY